MIAGSIWVGREGDQGALLSSDFGKLPDRGLCRGRDEVAGTPWGPPSPAAVWGSPLFELLISS